MSWVWVPLWYLLCLPYCLTQTIDPRTSLLTSDFRQWLNDHNYASYDFPRTAGLSYGGKANANTTCCNQRPVVFIHGNSDQAVGTSTNVGQSGWTTSINYFLQHGYTSAELYAITWGPHNAALASQQYHSKPYLTRLRAFLQAVQSYTGASKIDVIGHSMGVTLARKAIQGGKASDALHGGGYDLGPPLSFVETFLGIAGANWGLTACFATGPTTPTCGSTNGFYPGYMVGVVGPVGVSAFLESLNSGPVASSSVFTMWSLGDQIVGGACVVWGRNTCRIRKQQGEKVYTTYGHFMLKDKTAAEQLQILQTHKPE